MSGLTAPFFMEHPLLRAKIIFEPTICTFRVACGGGGGGGGGVDLLLTIKYFSKRNTLINLSLLFFRLNKLYDFTINQLQAFFRFKSV